MLPLLRSKEQVPSKVQLGRNEYLKRHNWAVIISSCLHIMYSGLESEEYGRRGPSR
jgi:hypothetical protein